MRRLSYGGDSGRSARLNDLRWRTIDKADIPVLKEPA